MLYSCSCFTHWLFLLSGHLTTSPAEQRRFPACTLAVKHQLQWDFLCTVAARTVQINIGTREVSTAPSPFSSKQVFFFLFQFSWSPKPRFVSFFFFLVAFSAIAVFACFFLFVWHHQAIPIWGPGNTGNPNWSEPGRSVGCRAWLGLPPQLLQELRLPGSHV